MHPALKIIIQSTNVKKLLGIYGPPHMAGKKQDDQIEHTFSSYLRIRDVVLKTCQRRWTIGRSGERGSGISVLAARHDDDDSRSGHFKNTATTKTSI